MICRIKKKKWYPSYTLSDGQEREESGYFKDVGDLKIWTVSGMYTFEGTDGITYTVRYESDEEGYRASTSVSLIGTNQN